MNETRKIEIERSDPSVINLQKNKDLKNWLKFINMKKRIFNWQNKKL